MGWISVKDRLPENSECVLITDGRNVGGAHYFSGTFNPRTQEAGGPVWANQHYRLLGGFITPTHWMPPEELLRGLEGCAYLFDDEYSGPRYTYGVYYKVAHFDLPDGWIINSNRPHADYPGGTIDYPFELTPHQCEEFKLERI